MNAARSRLPPARPAGGQVTRQLLLGTGLAGAATGVGVYRAAYQTNFGQLTFTDPLPIPPMLDPDRDGRATR